MSGWSDSQDCPECWSRDSLMTYGSNRPYDSSGGNCLECGFCYYTKEGQETLEEVNKRREDYDLEPLAELKQQTPV